MSNATFSVVDSMRLFLEWAKEHHLGPLQTVSLLFGIVFLLAMSKFVRKAKDVVGGVHHVYEQALEDQKKAAQDLREQLQAAVAARRRVAKDLEKCRTERDELLAELRGYRQRPKLPPTGEA